MPNDLVVLLPGILGSVLADRDGNEVWAPNASAVWQLITSGGGSVENLVVPPDGSDDGIRATRLVPDATVIPGFMKIDGYTGIQKLLCAELNLVEGENFRAFPYDWRQDNQTTAVQFKVQALVWLEHWRSTSGNAEAGLVLVAHSMGGLIARYFVECLEGWTITRRLITLGTPHRGAPQAAGILLNGMKKGYGPFGVDLSPLVRSCPSVYQLLPLYPCIAQNGPQLRIIEAIEQGILPGIELNRVREAVEFHRLIQAAVESNSKNAAYIASGYNIVPIVGIDQPTVQSISLQGKQSIFLRGVGTVEDDGDGTVPRGSATPLELHGKLREIYTSELHGSLQNNAAVMVNLRGLVTALDIDWRKFMSAADAITLSLDVDDLIEQGEHMTVRARPSTANCQLQLRIEQLPNGEIGLESLTRDGDSGWHSVILNLPPGTWRLTVFGDGVAPASTLAVVGSA